MTAYVQDDLLAPIPEQIADKTPAIKHAIFRKLVTDYVKAHPNTEFGVCCVLTWANQHTLFGPGQAGGAVKNLEKAHLIQRVKGGEINSCSPDAHGSLRRLYRWVGGVA